MAVISFSEYKHKKSGASASRPAASAPIRPGHARLLKATRGLHEAALRQNERVKEFHAVTLVLKEKITKLEESCVLLDGNFRQIGVKRLSRSAKKLVDRMDPLLSS